MNQKILAAEIFDSLQEAFKTWCTGIAERLLENQSNPVLDQYGLAESFHKLNEAEQVLNKTIEYNLAVTKLKAQHKKEMEEILEQREKEKIWLEDFRKSVAETFKDTGVRDEAANMFNYQKWEKEDMEKTHKSTVESFKGTNVSNFFEQWEKEDMEKTHKLSGDWLAGIERAKKWREEKNNLQIEDKVKAAFNEFMEANYYVSFHGIDRNVSYYNYHSMFFAFRSGIYSDYAKKLHSENNDR